MNIRWTTCCADSSEDTEGFSVTMLFSADQIDQHGLSGDTIQPHIEDFLVPFRQIRDLQDVDMDLHHTDLTPQR